MLISTKAGVKTGTVNVPVPVENPGPLEVAQRPVGLPIVAIDYYLPQQLAPLTMAMPLEVARDLHRLLGSALDGKSDLIIPSERLPESG